MKMLSPHHLSKEPTSIMQPESTMNGGIQGVGVVDLRMKQHANFDALSTFATTPASQPLPAQSARSVEKYLNHIEGPNEMDPLPDTGYIQSRNSIIATGRQMNAQQPVNMMQPAANSAGKLDALVNSVVDSHCIRNNNNSPTALIGTFIM